MKTLTARAKPNEIGLPFKKVFGLEADEIKVTGAVDPTTGKIATRKIHLEMLMTHLIKLYVWNLE